MSVCYCDGPGHQYKASWCQEGRDDHGQPINKSIAAARLELRAAQLRAEAAEE